MKNKPIAASRLIAELNQCFRQHYQEKEKTGMCFRITDFETIDGKIHFKVKYGGNSQVGFTAHFTKKMFIWVSEKGLVSRMLVGENLPDFFSSLAERLIQQLNFTKWEHLDKFKDPINKFLIILSNCVSSRLVYDRRSLGTILLTEKNTSNVYPKGMARFLLTADPVAMIRNRSLIDPYGTTDPVLVKVTNLITGQSQSMLITTEEMIELCKDKNKMNSNLLAQFLVVGLINQQRKISSQAFERES